MSLVEIAKSPRRIDRRLESDEGMRLGFCGCPESFDVPFPLAMAKICDYSIVGTSTSGLKIHEGTRNDSLWHGQLHWVPSRQHYWHKNGEGN